MSKDTKGQVENILTELGKKIDQLIQDAKGAKDDVRDEVEKKIQELKKRKDKLEQDFEEYKDNNEDKWADVKNHLVGAVHELKRAVEAAFKKKEA